MNNKRYERLPCSSYIYVIELDDWVCPAGCGCSIYNCSGVRWILTFLTPTRGIHNLVSLPYCKQHIHSYQQHCNLPNTDITNTTMLISKGGIRRPAACSHPLHFVSRPRIHPTARGALPCAGNMSCPFITMPSRNQFHLRQTVIALKKKTPQCTRHIPRRNPFFMNHCKDKIPRRRKLYHKPHTPKTTTKPPNLY